MKYKLSKLVIGLAAVCAFSGQAVAGGAIAVVSDPDGDHTYIGEEASKIGFSDVVTGAGSIFHDAFTFSLTGKEAGNIVLNGLTTSANIHGLNFTLYELTKPTLAQDPSWSSTNTVKFGATYDGLTAKLGAGNYELIFSGTEANGKKGTITGNFTITPVPEPTEGALLLSGLGLFGFIAARRSRNQA